MKNAILKTITAIMIFIFLLGAACLDSISNIPAVMCIIALAWLAPFAYANRGEQ